MLASQIYFSCKSQQFAMLPAPPPNVSAPVHQQPFHSLLAVTKVAKGDQPSLKNFQSM